MFRIRKYREYGVTNSIQHKTKAGKIRLQSSENSAVFAYVFKISPVTNKKNNNNINPTP